jgi:metabotropic X receptor
VAELMRAVARSNATGHFAWIGSDGWSARGLVTQVRCTVHGALPLPQGQESVVEGTISLQPQAHPVRGFEEYFLGLTPAGNPRNPWFVGEAVASVTGEVGIVGYCIPLQ